MCRARERSEWGRMSSLMALIANVNRGKGARSYKPDDFSPFKTPAPKRVWTAQDFKAIFVDRRAPEGM